MRDHPNWALVEHLQKIPKRPTGKAVQCRKGKIRCIVRGMEKQGRAPRSPKRDQQELSATQTYQVQAILASKHHEGTLPSCVWWVGYPDKNNGYHQTKSVPDASSEGSPSGQSPIPNSCLLFLTVWFVHRSF
ncbi:hypothetical protein RvY_16875 [Ramazzottius varieornatus]|uniref:Uncharacterized protein n=1 Tax=Ramazzottius varieornatus TaxID=947166 RepID=A0A1D1W0Q5_RAMVA|nr:hypothetical protein RvY_16875 [Ramazzottius varieornatus]